MMDLNGVLDPYNLKIVLLLAIGFACAGILGYFAWRIKVSPILAYLLTGYIIGPYSPGFVADIKVSEQLAEIGVILMMFGVGLDFTLNDLMKVKKIAITGAVAQTLISAMFGALIIYLFGWSLQTGVILGFAIGVASTVVLIRMLEEHQLLQTREGHIAVGWLIVEDIITVVFLLLLPGLSIITQGKTTSFHELLSTFGFVLLKFGFLALVLLTFGKKSVSYILTKVVQTKSHELFTISVLAIVFVIAIGTTFFFGISIALGSFIAGMIIRQTKAHHKVLIHSLAMKDAFIAVFFLSVGMLFNPFIIIQNFGLFLSILSIILIIKPIVAFLIVRILRYQIKTAWLIAVALAQIGEFSFILSEEALRLKFITNQAYGLIVASALISIAINPFMFKIFYKDHSPQNF